MMDAPAHWEDECFVLAIEVHPGDKLWDPRNNGFTVVFDTESSTSEISFLDIHDEVFTLHPPTEEVSMKKWVERKPK